MNQKLSNRLGRRTAACLLVAIFALPGSARAGVLQPPWPLAISVPKKLQAQANCDNLPEPVLRLATSTIYDENDLSRTEIDPEAQEAYLAEVAPIRDYARKIVSLANSFALSHGKNRKAAQCAVRGILAWAEAGALSEASTQIAMFNRATFLAAISSAYIQVRQSPELQDESRKLIEGWLKRLAGSTREFYEKKRQSKSVAPNNIQYWGSLGVAMAAIATDDAGALNWAVEAVRLGACQATAEGALPRELARKKRALHYHLFAIAPLVALAEIAERNGLPGYSACDGALHRIIAFTLRSLRNPEEMAALAGAEQLSEGELRSNTALAWLEIYWARFAGASWSPESYRPLSSSYLGGNLTELYSGNS